MWCIRCGQDVPWTASAEAGRLVCSRCGATQEQGTEPESPTPSGHVPLNIPINSVHNAHRSSVSAHASMADMPVQDASLQKAGLDDSDWPVSSAYDGWKLDEQLDHIRETLDLLSGSAPATEIPSIPIEELPRQAHRFDAVHDRKQGLHRRATKGDHSRMGHFIFGLVFLMLGTGILALSIASITPRQIWWSADLPIAGVAFQVLGVFLVGLGLSAQLRRFHAALRATEAAKPYRRFDEPQMGHKSPHLDAKVRS